MSQNSVYLSWQESGYSSYWFPSLSTPFLRGPVVAAEGDLNWIQRRISKFGGDPDNVTIYGEGAGGASVVMQVVTYGGCPASGTDAMPCLRNASLGMYKSVNNPLFILIRAGAIVSGINRVPNGAFAPVIEGPDGFLPDLPSRLITAGKISNAEFVGGHCTGDGKSFAGGSPDNFQTDDDIRQRVFSRWPGVSNTTIDRALAIYPEPNAPRKSIRDSVRSRINHGWGDHLHLHVRHAGMHRTPSSTTRLLTAEQRIHQISTIYLKERSKYDEFEANIQSHRAPSRVGNAGNTFTLFHTSEAVLAKEAVAYWTPFAATGNPSTDRESISPVWESFVAPDSSHRRLMLTPGGNTATMETISEAEIQRCQFWMSEAVTAETRV
ncbi:Alpha/Beta hydrolase protein [Mycena galericulata]|nr:Alpha/Beta hydrolase protein [Mycena galericulata]